MSWRMEFFHKVIAGFLLTLLMMISHSEGLCRHLAIMKMSPGKVLVNHTVHRIQPTDQRALCASKCYLEPLCFSYNFCEDHISGLLCELLDSDHIRHGEHLVDKEGCTFYGSETSCSTNPCANNATCQGDFSGEDKPYRCVCQRGFTGQNCEIDEDECANDTHDCHVNATCINVIGAHICTCKKGFYGNGTQCNDRDECTNGTHDCHVNATCTNVIGGHNYTCKLGFFGNGSFCQDEDECAKGTHDCHVNATCTNVIGGYNCTCKIGFYGNGKHFNVSVLRMDFENGIAGWNKTGTAFNNQPTYGDNPTARKPSEPAQQQGDWWIGGFENRPSPCHPAGQTQDDGPKGTLTSPAFRITGQTLSFLIGGGCDITKVRVELLIGQEVVKQETGKCTESMERRFWDVSAYQGQVAQVRLVDNSSGGWGHINFDDLRFVQDDNECAEGAHGCHVNATCTNVIGGHNCTCKDGFYGNGSFCQRPKSCEELKLFLPSNTSSGHYEHELEGGSVGKVFCSYKSIAECGAGPWTLAMKIDGSKDNFIYDSGLWTQKSVFNPDGSGLDGEETVSPAYWTTPLTKLCLGMRYNDALNWILINVTASSLHDIMANQSHIKTDLGEAKWRSLLASTSLEANCNMEGFNLRCESSRFPDRRLRLGFFTNNGDDCLSCLSYVGLGPMVTDMNVAPACGNHAMNDADKGAQNHAAFCYLLIQ